MILSLIEQRAHGNTVIDSLTKEKISNVKKRSRQRIRGISLGDIGGRIIHARIREGTLKRMRRVRRLFLTREKPGCNGWVGEISLHHIVEEGVCGCELRHNGKGRREEVRKKEVVDYGVNLGEERGYAF